MTDLRSEKGQATVLTVLFLLVLLAMTAAVLDVGNWFRSDRDLQADADAAALAGAQFLPESAGGAVATAVQYGDKNGGGVDADDVSITTKVVDGDTIVIDAERTVDGVFTPLVGIDSAEVHARAVARAGNPSKALWVAPIVVNEKHPMLTCSPQPCFGTQTELEYHHLKSNGPSGPDGPGSFGFIDLLGNNNPGTSDLRNQILNGFDKYMALGSYNARTGNPFSAIKDALEARMGEEMLFPVYRKLTGTGSNAKYEIIGWVGFVLTDMNLNGNNEKFFGYFTRVIWDGILSEDPDTPDYGVRIVALVE
jgi:hypothetical protein